MHLYEYNLQFMQIILIFFKFGIYLVIVEIYLLYLIFSELSKEKNGKGKKCVNPLKNLQKE